MKSEQIRIKLERIKDAAEKGEKALLSELSQ
jgi:hypothetical protein